MNRSQQAKFDTLYSKHVSALKRQGKADKTVEACPQRTTTLIQDTQPAGSYEILGQLRRSSLATTP